MLCNNCGYENPSVHRYCGMCGTPFPHRALTAAEGQSTLAFGSAPLESVASTLQAVDLVRPAEPEMVAPAEVTSELPASEQEIAPQEPEAPVAEPAAEPVEDTPTGSQNELVEAQSLEAAAAEFAGEPASLGESAPPAPPSEEVEAGETAEPNQPPAQEVEAEAAAPAEAEEPVSARDEVSTLAARLQPFLVEPSAEPSAPAQPIEIKRAPETLPFESPPASAGMPTFQEVQDAAGAPQISPFEPPVTKPDDEDQDLKEFVANFKWTPPDETADELTMRSEVPVVDQEEPAEFHHPSFDNDEPPPETEPHPTGQEFYAPGQVAQRARFLEISEAHSGSPSGEVPAGVLESGGTARSSKWWLWTSILALIAVFGGLGFWEGRAQSTHAFRGPVELLREQYEGFRQKMDRAGWTPAASTDTKPGDSEKPAEPQTKSAEQQTQDATQQAKTADGDKPAETISAPATQPAPAVKDEPKTEAASTEPPKAIQAPPLTRVSSKSQPGQQELEKAANASDATAAAAWLWKATSRGNPEAPVRLADMYLRGNGVPKSCEQALVLLRSAAAKENAPARNRLAALYANGNCVVRDRVRAYQLMSSALAADPASEWAKENRQILWDQMTPQERSAAQKTQ